MQKLLIIGQTWPEPSSTAAGTRTLQLLQLFTDTGYEITFASDAQKTDRSHSLPASIHQQSIKLNDPSFGEFLKDLRPDIVLYDRFITEEKYGWRVRESLPGILDILDTQDLHCLRNARKQALDSLLDYRELLPHTDLAYREIASIYRTRLTLVISEFEMELLFKLFDISPELLLYLPFVIAEFESESAGLDARRDFMHIGNFLHQPNVDAVQELKRHIWPIIRKRLPEASIHIYGPYAPPHIQQMHDPKTGFIIAGAAEDLKSTYEQHRLVTGAAAIWRGTQGQVV